MKGSFVFGLMRIVVILTLTAFVSSCLSVISEEISEGFDRKEQSYSLSFDEPAPKRFILIDGLLINTDSQTVTVNEEEIRLSTVEYRVIEKICKKISERSDIFRLQGGYK